MAWGTMAVDWETRVDFDRLRKYRLQRAKEQIEKHKLGAVLCFDFNNIRYISSITLGEWARDKMSRYVLLPRGQDFISYEGGSSVEAKKLYSPWVRDRLRMSRMWARGGVPQAIEICDAIGRDIAGALREFGLEKEPLGIDLADMSVLAGLRKAGIENLVDAQPAMLDARLIKSQDEIQLLKGSAAMADAAYDTVVRSIRPGIRENELVGKVNDTLYSLGSELVECVNVVSGPRSSPHPHIFSDRMIRPGEFVFFDIMHKFNGYSTCYYRSFMCGRPTQAQKDAYKKCYDWLYDAIDIVKPGITTSDIVKKWPTADAWGFKSEADARGSAVGHGIGLSIHEKPFMSRLYSLDRPYPIEEGMVIAMETYAQTPDGKHGCRIEEEVLVTKEGHEVLTKYPCEELISVGVPKYW